ncbi:PIN domain-containing protein [Nocardia amikacinitolerans]|uniref:PIN domain-containing protein n=1 Tax=Nocardia amikacinitolerans TaxID=756689 RepID=UPI0036777719
MSPAVEKRFLLDCSAWSRMKAGQLDEQKVLSRYVDDRSVLVTTTAQILEMLFTARNPAKWDALRAELGQHSLLPHTRRTHEIAVDIQGRLWHCGRKRSVGVIDVTVAAAAVQYGAIVVHYDSDFAHIAHVVPEFVHEWVVPRGSL